MNASWKPSDEELQEHKVILTNSETSSYFSSYLYIVERESFKCSSASMSSANVSSPTHPKVDMHHDDSDLKAPALHGFPSTTGTRRKVQGLKKPYRKRTCSHVIRFLWQLRFVRRSMV